MKKVNTNQLTAGLLSKYFKESVKSFVVNDEALVLIIPLKVRQHTGNLFQVLAIVKKLGLATFFMTLSCADLTWNGLVSIITKLNGLNLSQEDISNIYRVGHKKRN